MHDSIIILLAFGTLFIHNILFARHGCICGSFLTKQQFMHPHCIFFLFKHFIESNNKKHDKHCIITIIVLISNLQFDSFLIYEKGKMAKKFEI